MVEFFTTPNEKDKCVVIIDGRPFGYIRKDRGFSLTPGSIREFIKVSPQEFREIADKIEEVCGKV